MRRTSFFFGFALLLVACSGVGTDATNEGGSVPDVSLGGSGGSAKGGSAGHVAGGAAGSAGGKFGVTGGAAGAGGSVATGGSGGKATGGSGTGGSGKAGSSTGGTSNGGTSTGGTSTGGSAGGTAFCGNGQIICEGFNAKTCDGKGGFLSEMACSNGCAPGVGCVNCIPNSGSCNGDVAMHCKSDGSGYVTETCDSVIGVTCDPTTFTCKGACAPSALGSSYIGCEYWPTTVANLVWSSFDFAVAVANPGTSPAMITVDRAGATVATATVQPGSLEIIKLPWVPEVKGPDTDAFGNAMIPETTRWAPGGAYRLRSTQPVSAYQFNALEYTLTPSDPGYASCPGNGTVGCNSYSNDASLLLPTNVLTGHYRVFTYPAWDAAAMPDYAAIIATKDGTNVTFTSSTNTQAGGPVGALSAGQMATFTMNAGDVLEIMSNPGGANISGSAVNADQPVQVIAGLPCVYIPDGVQACDHIEETLLPIETLGNEYLVTSPQTPEGVKNHEVRVHGVLDGTTITVDPPGPMGATISLNAGDTVSFGVVQGDYHLSSNNRFYVSQYMVGGQYPGNPNPDNDGDPSQSNGVPVQQYRTDYTFLAPSSYPTNFVNVTAPSNATVTLDGAAIPAGQFTPIGSSSFSVARVQLSQSQVHKISSSAQIGIVVYGYGSYTSYMYPGGMNLEKL